MKPKYDLKKVKLKRHGMIPALRIEEAQIIESLKAMKKSKCYLNESEEITNTICSHLPVEKDEWWRK